MELEGCDHCFGRQSSHVRHCHIDGIWLKPEKLYELTVLLDDEQQAPNDP
jgi:hypothetical protein